MSFQPVIPMSGNSGWKYLQATYDRQLSTHANSAQIKADRAYLTSKLSEPMTTEAFLDDRRLLRVAMAAFDLGGEEWKRGFIDKVLKEAATPGSNFLTRLNNPKYTAFAEAFKPVDGKITLTAEAVQKIAGEFDTASFETAVGQVNETMRIALNFKSEIAGLAGSSSSENAKLFRILGNVPVRTLLETALNLPTEMRKLDIEKQAEILKDALQKRAGVSDLNDLTRPDVIDRIIGRYHVMETVKSGAANYSPAANALTLLNGGMGLGGQGGINLLFSGS